MTDLEFGSHKIGSEFAAVLVAVSIEVTLTHGDEVVGGLVGRGEEEGRRGGGGRIKTLFSPTKSAPSSYYNLLLQHQLLLLRLLLLLLLPHLLLTLLLGRLFPAKRNFSPCFMYK